MTFPDWESALSGSEKRSGGGKIFHVVQADNRVQGIWEGQLAPAVDGFSAYHGVATNILLRVDQLIEPLFIIDHAHFRGHLACPFPEHDIDVPLRRSFCLGGNADAGDSLGN